MNNHEVIEGTNGRAYRIDETGKATLIETWACQWLVEKDNGNPEPSCPADCYDIVPCEAPAYTIVDGWACTAGHHHYTYGSATQQAEERNEALYERIASTR